MGSTNVNENRVWEEHFQNSAGNLGDEERTFRCTSASKEGADIQWYFQDMQVPISPGNQWVHSENSACQVCVS